MGLWKLLYKNFSQQIRLRRACKAKRKNVVRHLSDLKPKRMTKILLTLITFLLISSTSFGQIEQLQLFKKLYETVDSLNKIGHPFRVDSLTFIDAKQLDKEHPAKYFEKAGELFKNSKYNDAAFIYYLGLLRYRYYNTVNPKYQASGDGALAASLQYVFGETINLYLKTNIDNFKSALQISSDYYAKNDYTFYPKKKNIEKYNKLIDSYSGLIKDLETNRTKYQKEWEDEKKMMIENIDKSIDEYNKMTPEEKAKLKDNN